MNSNNQISLKEETEKIYNYFIREGFKIEKYGYQNIDEWFCNLVKQLSPASKRKFEYNKLGQKISIENLSNPKELHSQFLRLSSIIEREKHIKYIQDNYPEEVAEYKKECLPDEGYEETGLYVFDEYMRFQPNRFHHRKNELKNSLKDVAGDIYDYIVCNTALIISPPPTKRDLLPKWFASIIEQLPLIIKQWYNQNYDLSTSNFSIAEMKKHFDILKEQIIGCNLYREDFVKGTKYVVEMMRENKKEAERIVADRNKRHREAEINRIAFEKARALEEDEKQKKYYQTRFMAAVSNWDELVCGGLRYKYLLNYYPTNLKGFEATPLQWEDRRLVWNFKNVVGKTDDGLHEIALRKVIPELKKILANTFGYGMKYLTLVCAPASTSANNIRRYEEFSRRFCEETGMENSFAKIQVIRDKLEKRNDGVGVQMDNISFQRNFFRDKYVILFDDVISTGSTMMIMQRELELMGAKVVGCLCIGRTRHHLR